MARRFIASDREQSFLMTIVRFVDRHQLGLGELFGAVLGLCARAGLVGLNVVAVDGSKVSANASREANVDYERLAREVIEDARAVDAEEDERFSDRRGDELPPDVSTHNGRQQWFGWRLGPATVPKPYTPPEVPPGEINTTDLDSRMVKGQHGFLQGYNAQAAA